MKEIKCLRNGNVDQVMGWKTQQNKITLLLKLVHRLLTGINMNSQRKQIFRHKQYCNKVGLIGKGSRIINSLSRRI